MLVAIATTAASVVDGSPISLVREEFFLEVQVKCSLYLEGNR